MLRRFKTDPRLRAVVLAVNAGGVAFGFYYYLPQFQATPPWLWPLVPDSPFAVLVATAALLLWGVGRPNKYVDAVAFVYMAKVGLWTAFVLALHPAHFNFAPFGTGLNTLLFYLHLGMAAEAFVFLPDLERLGAGWIALLGWFLGNDWADYFWSGYVYPGRECPGLFPYTVPCTNVELVAALTLILSLGLLALAYVAAARRS